MVPLFVTLGARIKVAPVLAIPKEKVDASYIVLDTMPVEDSFVIEAIAEELNPIHP